mgnify:FL=1|tara:strand:+ start:125 stop:3097 length:2973 start_codon:yes stop_codon:yes gene_type:complete
MKKYYCFLIVAITIFTNLSSQTIDATLIELNSVDDSSPRYMVEKNNKLYFSAKDNIHGRELWSLDLASKEAFLIKDINPGYNGGLQFSNHVFVNDILFFSASDGVNGYELWRSDGTESGTYMVKDINISGSSSIENMISYNGNLVFSADDGINGQEIWISNGSENGTYLLKDIKVGPDDSDIADIFEFNGNLYFSADNGINSRELWVSDGTPGGTSILIDLSVDYNGVVDGNNFIIFDNHFYFLAGENSFEYHLWKSDGTAAGTSIVKEIYSSMGLTFGAVTNNYFIFSALTNGIGREIWVSDGTNSGTQLIKDIFPGFPSGINLQNRQFAILNNKVYFLANDGVNGNELWVTDGTSNGTQIVKDIFPGSHTSGIVNLTSNGQYLIFAAQENYNSPTSLWKSDGTMAGTIEIIQIDLNKDYGYTMQFLEVNDKFYFQGADKTLNGIEIWETNGIPENTALTVDINHRRSSNPIPAYSDRFITPLNDKSVMFAKDGLHGAEPFSTNGTVNGTFLLKDIMPNDDSSIDLNQIPDFNFKKAGGKLFFRALDPLYGYELFMTDGTSANTSIVKNIAPGAESSIVESFLFIEYNDDLYFKANDQVHGGELWRTDGTETGTFMLKDIYLGPGHGIENANYRDGLNYHTVMNGLLYFNADDGVENAIWKTDGTESGTVKAISIPSSGNNDNGPVVLNSSNGKLYFATNPNNTSYGYFSLNVSDGTQSNITTLGTWLSPVHFEYNIIYNNEFYFMVRDGFGLGLMKTDGTVNGTVMVKGGMERSYVKYMGICGPYLYFSVGEYNEFDSELWRTDGTADGTIRIAENELRNYTCIENKLAYLDGVYGDNLWITDGTNKNSVAINVLNGEQLDNNYVRKIESYSHNKIYFISPTLASGEELYVAGVSEILNVNDYNTQTANSEDKIIIYPNPTKGFFTIASEENLILYNLEILDFSGKNILRKDIGSKSANFDISNLSKGLYIVKIKTTESVITKKIILN